MTAGKYDVIVIGAGIGGLTAAYTAAQAGKSVLVLEAGDRPGGRIVRLEHRGDMVEGGAQGIHTNYDEMLRLVNAMGLRGDLRPTSGHALFLDRGGAPRLVRSNNEMLRVAGPRAAADMIRYRTSYFTLRKRMPQFEIVRDVPEYDNVTAAEALSWASKDFHDFVLRPQTHAQCGVTPEHCNLYHLVNMLRIRLTTEAMGLRTGIVTLCERLAEQVEVRYGQEVSEVLTSGGVVDGVRLANDDAIKAGHVVVACAINAAARIVPDAFGPAKTFLSTFTSTPQPMVYFFLDRPLGIDAYAFMGHAFHDVTYNMALDHLMKTPYMVPSGKSIVSAWPAYPGGAAMLERSDADITKQALSDLDPMFPGIANMVEAAHVQRHTWGFARYEPGTHSRLLDFKKYVAGIEGMSFVGNDYDGVHMEAAVRGGQRAAARALAA